MSDCVGPSKHHSDQRHVSMCPSVCTSLCVYASLCVYICVCARLSEKKITGHTTRKALNMQNSPLFSKNKTLKANYQGDAKRMRALQFICKSIFGLLQIWPDAKSQNLSVFRDFHI
eukprot:TRINITY_DN58_c0_g1_i2.p1 TRINITY_DN58_c0_g1~~TRINITY_DN58_c0_g1_i2.p1  ORF type:complete len:116 (+),score=8.06 TRINITY_DN58_c0_g1_i2:575-922(+)